MSKNYQLSPGGCGSCALEDFFGNNINFPRDSWNAHQRDPSLPEAGSQVGYIFADPYNVVLSYFRRGFLQYPYDHGKHISGDMSILMARPSWTMEDFFRLPSDPFRLQDHMEGWWNRPQRDYNIMFIRYETLTQHLPELCQWFGLSPERAKHFEFIPRNSDWEQQSGFVKENLERMYGVFDRRL